MGVRRLVWILILLFTCSAWSSAWGVGKITVIALFKEKAVVLIDGKQRTLSAGNTSPEGVKLVAADSNEAVLEIGGKRKSYTIGAHITSNYTPPPPQAGVQVYPDATGMYFVNGSINGYPVRFLIDTGASSVALNRNAAKRLAINYKLDGVEGQASTASGVTRAYYLTLKNVKVGEIAVDNVPATVIDGDFPAEVLLGNTFLGEVKMIRNGQVLTLQKKF